MAALACALVTAGGCRSARLPSLSTPNIPTPRLPSIATPSFGTPRVPTMSQVTAPFRKERIRESRDNHIHEGEIMHGRVPTNRPTQSFTIDGVASSMIDITVRAEVSDQAAPLVRVFDPQGRKLEVKKNLITDAGAATKRARNIVMVNSGRYRIEVERAKGMTKGGFYTFSYSSHYPGPGPKVVRVTAAKPWPIEFTAPAYGRVVAVLQPRSRMTPDVMAVYDPEGGPALDPSRTPRGQPRPVVDRRDDGTMVVAFTAPKAGRYRLMVGAKRGCSGLVGVSVRVRSLPNERRHVDHTGEPVGGYGADATRTREALASGPFAPRAMPPGRMPSGRMPSGRMPTGRLPTGRLPTMRAPMQPSMPMQSGMPYVGAPSMPSPAHVMPPMPAQPPTSFGASGGYGSAMPTPGVMPAPGSVLPSTGFPGTGLPGTGFPENGFPTPNGTSFPSPSTMPAPPAAPQLHDYGPPPTSPGSPPPLGIDPNAQAYLAR